MTQQTWHSNFTKKDVQITQSEILLTGHFDVIKHDLKFKLFQGGWSPVIQRTLVKRRSAAAVLLYNPDEDTITLVEQMRVGALSHDHSPWLLEPVAGLIEHNATPEDTAYREAIEEANCQIHKLIYICDYLVSCGMSDERCYLFCGLVKKSCNGDIFGLPEEAENIKVHTFPTSDIPTLLQSPQACTGPTIIALQWVLLNLSNLSNLSNLNNL